jgi:aryl-alcohol dehydrogenase-like predicted oxidoreductase
MKYIRLGSSGLKISRIALGCWSFGDGSRNTWALGEDEAAPLFRAAVESGITFWDTANVYSFGASERITGAAIKKFTRREDVVLATKVHQSMGPGPGESGSSRRAIMEQIDASLKRLGTDYVDLYQVHRFDTETPVEETMEALHDVIKAGKARYIGASSMHAWQFAKMQEAARVHGWTPFISMQNQYSLLMREDERDMMPLLLDQRVGSIPWAPLANGRVARPWLSGGTARAEKDTQSTSRYEGHGDRDAPVVGAVQKLAENRGVPMAQVGLAWLLHKPVVNAPVVGATKPKHITDAAAAVELELTAEEMIALEEGYTPREPTGFR